MATSEEQNALRHMILSFRVSELQMLLGFAGRNKNGKKEELQARALELLKIRSNPMQNKIRELYKICQESQTAELAIMNSQSLYPGMNYSSAAAAAAMMSMGGAYAATQQAALQGRNPYNPTTIGYPAQAHPNMYAATPYQQIQPVRSAPLPQDVKLVKLPFYDVHAELVCPNTVFPQGGQRFQDAQYQFLLTPQQATNIASNRDIQIGSKLDYLYQIQLRFFPLTLEPSKELSDEFPPNVSVLVNGKPVQLPSPIPTNKPGVEPKRPPRPVNITSLCKLSPILPNNIQIKWVADYNKGWVIGVWLVMKCSSEDLLDRLKQRGSRAKESTRQLIIDKLNDNDMEVATTTLKVSVLCPLGKMRMRVPCRPNTCSHLQCFDASTFLQMNEKKPTWNCPVCDSKATYDSLQIDGYFQEVLESRDLPPDDNDVMLEGDGSWKPVPKEEDKPKEASYQNGSTANKAEDNVDCIDLSDDDEVPLPAGPPLPPPPLPVYAPPPPPPPPREIECIDLD